MRPDENAPSDSTDQATGTIITPSTPEGSTTPSTLPAPSQGNATVSATSTNPPTDMAHNICLSSRHSCVRSV